MTDFRCDSESNTCELKERKSAGLLPPILPRFVCDSTLRTVAIPSGFALSEIKQSRADVLKALQLSALSELTPDTQRVLKLIACGDKPMVLQDTADGILTDILPKLGPDATQRIATRVIFVADCLERVFSESHGNLTTDAVAFNLGAPEKLTINGRTLPSDGLSLRLLVRAPATSVNRGTFLDSIASSNQPHWDVSSGDAELAKSKFDQLKFENRVVLAMLH